MWPFVLGGVVLVVIVLVAARNAFRRGVRAELVAWLKEHRPSWQLKEERTDALVLKSDDGEDIQFNLRMLFLQAAGTPNSTPENRKALFEQSIAALEEGMQLQHPSLEKHGDAILPRLVQQSFVAATPSLVRRALEGTPLLIVYVFNGKHGVSYITKPHLTDLGVDEESLHARALGNLRALVTDEMVSTAMGGKVSVVKTGDTFDAARILAIPSLLKEGEAVAATIPDRDTLALARVPDDGNWSGLHQIARKNVGPALLDVPLRITRDGFETVR